MIEVISALDPNSKEYNMEKIRWVCANDYVRAFGMSIPEAFMQLGMTYCPKDQADTIRFSFEHYDEIRNAMPEDERWLFDVNTIDGVIRVLYDATDWLPPDTVLTHLFPLDDYCEQIFLRVRDFKLQLSEDS